MLEPQAGAGAQTPFAVRVALIDDNGPFRAALLRTLHSLETVRVVGEAGDGENGLRMIAATQPQIVLLDIVMPGLDGWDVLEELRKRGPTPHVILLSSYMDAGLDRIARQHGADWGVAKGEVNDLLAAIEALSATIAREQQITDQITDQGAGI